MDYKIENGKVVSSWDVDIDAEIEEVRLQIERSKEVIIFLEEKKAKLESLKNQLP